MMDEYQECAKIIKESPAMIGVAFLLNLLQRVSVVAVTYCVYMGSGQTGHSFIDIMTVQGYVLIGSNSLPVPVLLVLPTTYSLTDLETYLQTLQMEKF